MENLNIDLSITISVIIALAAIISPILTAIINNAHQKKMKKLELDQEHYEKTVSYQKNIFEEYLRKAGNHIGVNCSDVKASKEYYNAYLAALLYAPNYLQLLMNETHNHMRAGQGFDASIAFEELIPSIQEYLNTL